MISPSGHREAIGWHSKPLGRALEKQSAGPRAGLAERRAAGLDGHRTGGHTFVRRTPRVRGHDLHACRRDVEFLGDDGAERREDALPDLHLAGEGEHTFVGHANPPIQGRRRGEAVG